MKNNRWALRAHSVLQFFRNPAFLFTAWMCTALTCCIFKLAQGRYNNYLIFERSFWHSLSQSPLYTAYPDEYDDFFLYAPSFTTIIAPFAVLPLPAGMILWCLANAALLFYAVRKLEPENWKLALVLWLSANELYEATVWQQYNTGIVAIVIMAFVCIEKQKDFWAALFIVVGTLTKVYGIVALAFFFFSKRKWHLIGGLLFWGAVFFLLPMLHTSPEYVCGQYREWAEILLWKDSNNMFTYHTNISLLGMVRKISGVATYSDLWLIVPGMVLFALPYLRIGQYASRSFRLLFLSSTILFYILFSTGTEGCGYIAAMIAAGIWFVSTPTRQKTPALNVALLILCLLLTVKGFLPLSFRSAVVSPYALKALPFTLIWFKIIWEQLTQDFTNPEKSLSASPAANKRRLFRLLS